MKDIERRLNDHFHTHDNLIRHSEARRLGVTEPYIRAALRSKRWVRVHRNVYMPASTILGPRGRLLAGLAAVDGAVASHCSAAWVHGLLKLRPEQVDLTIWGQHRRAPNGVRLHEVKRWPEIVTVDGIACTTATRTLVDLAATASANVLTAAVDKALQERLTAVPRLETALTTTERGRPGAAILRAVLDARGMIGTPAPSVLESRMDRLLHRSGLTGATAQHRVEGGRYRLDYAFPPIRLAIEVKGYVWHASPEALAADHERERHLITKGWTVLSFTWLDVVRHPDAVVADITAALARLAA